jgi:HSP20 family protein
MYPAVPYNKYIPSRKTEVLRFKENEEGNNATSIKCSIPGANIFETNNEYHIIIAAPGLYRDDFNIEIAESVITISAKKETPFGEKVSDRCEYDYTEWTRAFLLPEDADEFLANAEYQNGELNILIPRNNKSENRAKATIYVY